MYFSDDGKTIVETMAPPVGFATHTVRTGRPLSFDPIVDMNPCISASVESKGIFSRILPPISFWLFQRVCGVSFSDGMAKDIY
jgi:hypothetical protein